jgi:hypothetical protein
MLERLIDFAVHRRIAMLIVTAGFAVFGVVTFRKLKIEAFPDVTNVQVMVISLYPGQAAEEVEKKVTIPVEHALVGVPRVLVQRSITSFGLSQVILTFDDDVDIYFARQQVAERLPDAEVPDGVQPSWSPDSRHLVFTAVPEKNESWSTNYDICRVSVTNTSTKWESLTGSNLAADSGPVYSPDGSMIAFTAGTPPGLHCGAVRGGGAVVVRHLGSRRSQRAVAAKPRTTRCMRSRPRRRNPGASQACSPSTQEIIRRSKSPGRTCARSGSPDPANSLRHRRDR